MQYRPLAATMLTLAIAACGEVKDAVEIPDAPPPAPDAVPGVPDATVASCIADSSRSQRDSNTGIDWKPLWFCNNVGGALIFEGPSSGATREARMDTTYSWFVCWKRGEAHEGNNDVWYYTQGDRPEPTSSRNEWGFMAGYNVVSSVHPIAGMVECP